jgi:hypothetical protein
MQKKLIFSGQRALKSNESEVKGGYVEFDGEQFYRIENYNNMPPFFMSIVSDSDHWMFISSNGALSSGRKNPDNALFPYYTDDKITDSPEITGSKTIIFINRNNRTYLWEPFYGKFENQYSIKRNLYKNVYNNKLIFEEENTDLGVTFLYGWYNSDKYGFVKKSKIINNSGGAVEAEILDGIQNILPYGITRVLQNEYSTLVDAYKKNELLSPSSIGIYYLSSIPTDKAEPSEGLKASTVWSCGFKSAKRLLSSNQLNIFRKGKDITEETDIRALRGSYFVNTAFSLNPGTSRQWYIVAEINQDIGDIKALEELLNSDQDIEDLLEEDIRKGTENLVKIVANADGLQMTGDKLVSSRHFSNVLFNVMRGGIFDNNYSIDKNDFVSFINNINNKVARNYEYWLNGLKSTFEYGDLIKKAESLENIDSIKKAESLENIDLTKKPENSGNSNSIKKPEKSGNSDSIKKPENSGNSDSIKKAENLGNSDSIKKAENLENNNSTSKAENYVNTDLLRICYEYLPLTFSRRHGDPSRPWNLFSIETKNEDGTKSLYYQGNWRDIFQNWEALALSFPGFVESMICRFVNASTADGYNPYRITRDGIDWEVIDPSDPWSNIGYWGDHQVVYLLKLLEISKKYHPGKLAGFLTREMFVYANVPYRIKPYDSLLKDPQNTIDFDEELNDLIKKRVKETGADGKLLWLKDDNIYKVNLTEKLLVSLLAKLSNFIPEAGIWMNTQRPEWNDANNALVGSGVSMVTLYYMRRLVAYFVDMFDSKGPDYLVQSALTSIKLSQEKVDSDIKIPDYLKTLQLSEEVAGLLNDIKGIFINNKKLLNSKISDKARKNILDQLGKAGSYYRGKIYSKGFSGIKIDVPAEEIREFFKITLDHIDHSIRANKRDDGLYHAYNLMKVGSDGGISIRYLYEMLEGQVAMLSSGFLNASEAADLLDALRKSKMYRKDQNGYTLYPDRQLARFTEKNNIPAELAEKSELIKKLIEDNNKSIVLKDIKGNLHFNGAFRNAEMLRDGLEKLKSSSQNNLKTNSPDKFKSGPPEKSKSDYKELVERDYQLILDIFEKVFDHQSFTGRSGTFYKYEGLGCIYWHMVSKLLLVVEENFQRAYYSKADKETLGRLADHFYNIQGGIGVKKTPSLYGAFPTDPYSHTPGHTGAQQPGMTGQVKEDIITRFGELGIRVNNGEISFQPLLLKKEEFLSVPQKFEYYNVNGDLRIIELHNNSLAFTFCQVPVIYNISGSNKVSVFYSDGKQQEIKGSTINRKLSSQIFERDPGIEKIFVEVDL